MMTTIFDGVRKGDAVLAALLTALGAVLMIANIASDDPSVRIDSRSWLMVPVFAAVTLPILWRRRGMLAVVAVTGAALAVHVVAFGWVVRCGAGLPLAIALAYGVGRLTTGRQAWYGLAAVSGIQFLVLVRDSAAGLAIIPVTLAVGVAAWGVGVWLRRRALHVDAVPTPAPAAAHV